jgi:hypothetical protein
MCSTTSDPVVDADESIRASHDRLREIERPSLGLVAAWQMMAFGRQFSLPITLRE